MHAYIKGNTTVLLIKVDQFPLFEHYEHINFILSSGPPPTLNYTMSPASR